MLKGIIILIIILILAAAGILVWILISREHREASHLPLQPIDLSRIKDGTYTGEYAGGIYSWRANKVRVTIKKGKIIDIQLLYSKETEAGNFDYPLLKEKVLEAQSLKIDAVSGASLTSRAHLKAIEDALINAKKENQSVK